MRVIGGKYSGRRIPIPKKFSERPTTDRARESLFNILESSGRIEGARLLDLYCGTGSISLEFLSRGGKEAFAIDKSPLSKSMIRQIADEWELDNLHFIKGQVFQFLKNCGEQYDIVFADPPYGAPGIIRIPHRIAEAEVVAPGGLFILEHSKRFSFDEIPGFIEMRKYGHVCFSFFDSSIREKARQGA